MTTSPTSRRKPKESAFVGLVVAVWALAFGVYLFNKPDPSLWGLSSAYTYSLLWWIFAMIVFLTYFAIDVRGD